MEFLSSQFVPENNSFPVNLVLQSARSAKQGYVGSNTGNYIVANLPFNPTTGFHEYRFDFLPGGITFYADSKTIAIMDSSAAPTEAGHLILTHWSNGNRLWSEGPPAADAAMTVSYVKSYFNSSLKSRRQDFNTRCSNPGLPKAICPVPDQTVAPDTGGPNGNTTANTFFFASQFNMTNNQTIYHDSGATQDIHVVTSLIVSSLISLVIGY